MLRLYVRRPPGGRRTYDPSPASLRLDTTSLLLGCLALVLASLLPALVVFFHYATRRVLHAWKAPVAVS
jgi:hypothetical protein